MSQDAPIALCASADLRDGAQAVSFDLSYGGQTCRAFAIRYRGQVHAYLIIDKIKDNIISCLIC